MNIYLKISQQISNYAANCKFFPLALDESTDVTDTAQLCIFIRTINDRFEVYEELLAVEAMTGTTKGVNLFETLKACVERNNIDWTKLDSICTDGAPAFTGKNVGCIVEVCMEVRIHLHTRPI